MGILSQKRRQNQGFTGLKALAAGSLALARAHAVLDKTEKSLEEEIAKENRKPPSNCLGRSRFWGHKMMHTKQVLLCVVVLNIIDCVLVLGELILDIYYLKGVLDQEELANVYFVNTMKNAYPQDLHDLYETDINLLHSRIMLSHVHFSPETSDAYGAPEFVSTVQLKENETSSQSLQKLNKRSYRSKLEQPDILNKSLSVFSTQNTSSYFWNVGNKSNTVVHDADRSNSIEVVLAHKFHYCSVSILAILVVENVLKLLCSGEEYFEKKLEVFDGLVVVASFIVDLVFIKGLSSYKIQKFVVILAFLVPWRVIRVVNSLVVAVIDHEHFRMKLLYKQKKQVAHDLKSCKNENKSLQATIEALKSRASLAGVPETELDDIIASRQTPRKKKAVKKSSSTSFPSAFHLTSLGFHRQTSHNSNAEIVYVDVDNNTCYREHQDSI